MKKDRTRIVVPGRLSYTKVVNPDSVTEKYGTALIIPKVDTETVEKINAAIEEAKKASAYKWGGNIPPNLRTPLKDGDIEHPDDDAYVGCYFLNASSFKVPKVIDRRMRPMDPEKIYSGAYAKVRVNFYGYNKNGNRGISAGLDRIQFVRDGERLGGKGSSDDDDDNEGFEDLGDLPDDEDDVDFLY